MMKMIKIGIIDADPRICKAYKSHFSKTIAQELVFDYSSIEEFTLHHKILNGVEPDVIIMGDEIFNLPFLQVVQTVLNQYPLVKIMVFAHIIQIEKLLLVFNAGAHGYVSKTISLPALNRIIQDCLEYGTALSADATALMLAHTKIKINPNLYNLLTKREVEIASAIVGGKSYKELASQLFVSVFTINHHLKNIYSKLEVKSKSELISVLLNNRINV